MLAREAGLDAWWAGTIGHAAFAHQLSWIWAGLPTDASNRSYYQGLGDNAARIDHATVATLARLHQEAGVPSVP